MTELRAERTFTQRPDAGVRCSTSGVRACRPRIRLRCSDLTTFDATRVVRRLQRSAACTTVFLLPDYTIAFVSDGAKILLGYEPCSCGRGRAIAEVGPRR